MKDLNTLADEFVANDQEDLIRLRRMPEAQFAILLAMHAVAEVALDEWISRHKDED